MKLSLERINEKIVWDNFVESSKQGVVFNRSSILEIYSNNIDYWMVLKKQIPVLGIAILKRDKKVIHNFPFSYYQGPMFSNEINNLNSFKKFEWTSKILNFLFKTLSKEYRSFSMSLHWSIKDIRPLIWFNQMQSDLPKFEVNPQYTAIIDSRELNKIEHFKSFLRRDRKQDLRYAQNNNISLKKSNDKSEIIELYIDTLKEKNASVSQVESKILDNLMSLAINKKIGYLLKAFNGKKELIAAQFILEDKLYSHGIALVGLRKYNKIGVKTLLNLEWMKECLDRNLILDYNGANSPNLADYKHSMGAKEKVFFNAKLK